MDPNRPSDPTAAPNNQQQQNVHLHMHHICNCQGGLYPTAAAAAAAAAAAYYPTTVGYRTPLPSILPYHHHTSSAAAAAVAARPYLQHYQYTQFNVGSQYTVPIGHVSGSSSTSVYASGPAAAAAGASSTIDLVYAGAAAIKEKQRGEEGGGGDLERSNEVPPEGFDFGQVTPPAHELLVTDASDGAAHQENFIKFLERSCLTAEQIAYRNRNRPCFRNIQNLCIRTRSEILKPCTTISNIHSQGIPWATKDFIYAFVRLTNCWHILKGYWENRDGLSLGKIEKELTPEFRSCYMRWEKESMELAGELAKIFYNLDTNLNTASSGAGVYAANNMIPPQINLMKSSASEGTIKNKQQQQQTGGNDAGNGAAGKNVRGILHLPGNGGGATTVAETVDQANQTYAGDFCHNDEEYDSEGERTRRVYMKPGSYSVPKKGLEAATSSVGGAVGGNSPRAIEFLETAQNVNKARETVSERYWANIQLSNVTKKAEQQQQQQQKEYHILEEEMEEEARLNLSAHINVHEWLINSNFADFGEPKSPHAHQELKSFYLDSVYDSLPQLDSPVSGDGNGAAVTLLQRTKSMQVPSKLVNVQKQTPIGSAGRLIRKQQQQQQQQQKATSGGAATALPMMEMAPRRLLNPYELKGGGLTEAAQCVLENLVGSLKGHVLGPLALDGEKDLEKILQKIKNLEYSYVNEVVRDLRYIIKIWEEIDIHNVGWFSQKLDILLVENFSPFDFSGIAGLLNEIVGPLKHNVLTLFGSDCDPF